MKKKLRALLIEDSTEDVALLVRELQRGGYDLEFERVQTAEEMKAALGKGEWDIVLADYRLPQFSAPAALDVVKQSGVDLPFVVVTGSIGEETAVELIKAGADDYLLKDRLTRLGQAVARALEEKRLRDERKQAEERIRRQLDRLSALRSIDLAITSSLDLRVTLSVLLDQVTAQLQVDAADILLLKPRTQVLEYAAGRGFRTAGIQQSRLRLGEGHAGKAALERKMVSIPDLGEAQDHFLRASLIQGERFIAYYGVPLIAKGEAKGVMEIFHRSRLEPDPEWLGFLDALAGQAAIAIDNASLFDNLQRSNLELTVAYDATIEGWSKALDLRDKETEGHTQRVTEMTLHLARAMGMKEEEMVHIRRGALLHDMGKMGIPDNILLKPGPLSDEEWVIMKKHPQYAYDMLSPIAYLRPALDIPYAHHEKWDGIGYPRGLKGEGIPLAARIFSMADVWDALRSDRPYRAAWSEEKALTYIREQAGKHFDPQVVEAFLKLVGRPGP